VNVRRHETARAIRRRRRPRGRPIAPAARRPGRARRLRTGPGQPVRTPGAAHRLPRHHHSRQDVQLRQKTRVRSQSE